MCLAFQPTRRNIDRMRTAAKYLCITSVTMVLVTLGAMAAHSHLVSSMPGCITFKGEASELFCGSASGPINFFNGIVWTVGLLSYLVAAPFFAIGGLLWVLSSRVRATPLVTRSCLAISAAVI